MNDSQLSTPREWIERRLVQIAPELSMSAIEDLQAERNSLPSADSISLNCRLDVSYFPNGLDEIADKVGMPAADLLNSVQADLANGIAVQATSWTTNEGQAKVCLVGSRWRVILRPQNGKSTGSPLAVLENIQRQDIPTQQIRFRPISFRVHQIWDEVSCDLDALQHEHEASKAAANGIRQTSRVLQGKINGAHQRRKEALGSVARELRCSDADPAIRARSQLHASVRREYSALRIMMDLLRIRSEQEKYSATAEVVQSDIPIAREQDVERPDGPQADNTSEEAETANLRFRLLDRLPSEILDEGTLVEIHLPSQTRPRRARILSVETSSQPLVDVDLPHDVFPPGETVEIHTIPRFGMWAHQRAVGDLLTERVQGYWPDLAHLLCSPAELDAPNESATPSRFFCDADPNRPSLNSQQRMAVAGALASPHAFCIQGPPGTGKTTVICELVQQLIAKGERVLLVAPTHVAVDEVLRRIGSQESVRALRLSWDEGRVSEDVRQFTPSNIIDPFIQRVKNPDAGNADQWQRERDTVKEAAEELQNLRACWKRVRQCRQELHGEQQQLITDRHKHQDTAKKHFREMIHWIWTRCEEGIQTKCRDRLHQAQERKQVLEHDEVPQAEERLNVTRNDFTAEQPDIESRLEELARQIQIAEKRVARLQEELSYARTAHQTCLTESTWLGRRLAWFGLGQLGETQRWERLVAAQFRKEERSRDVLHTQRQNARARLDELGEAILEAQRRLAEAESLLADASRDETAATESLERCERLREHLDERCHAAQDQMDRLDAVSADGLHELSTIVEIVEDALLDELLGQDYSEELSQLRDGLKSRKQAAEEEIAWLAKTVSGIELEVARLNASMAKATQDRQMSTDSCSKLELLRECELDLNAVEHLLIELTERDVRLADYQILAGRFYELVAEANEEGKNPEGLRRDLLAVTNLFCCTTTGIAGSPELRDLVFDTLIVDEASRVTDSEFLIGAVRAKRWVLVGDEHQLPPYVEQDDEHFIHALSGLHQAEMTNKGLDQAVGELGDLWEEDEELHQFRRESVCHFAERIRDSGHWETTYRDAYQTGIDNLRREVDDPSRALLEAMRNNLVHSLFERMVCSCPASLKVRLVEQRRMIEPIASIVSRPVYGGDYQTPSPEDLAECGITPLTTPTFPTPVTFLDTSLLGIKARDELLRNSFVNRTEARWIVKACRTLDRELSQAGSGPVSVSILAFYKAQARLIRDRLDDSRHREKKQFACLRFSVIDSIDRIQGQESDVVFLSFCRTAGKNVSPRFGQWLQDVRRLNVACTRAHRALIFVGQKELLSKLCSNDVAVEFYRHLNDLFENRSEVMRVVRQFGGSVS